MMPLLLLLLMGIIEFSWLFAQNLDVKHGAREGARITAVNYPGTNNATIKTEICSRMDLVGGSADTSITWTPDNTPPLVGEGVKVTVQSQPTTLTGLLNWVLPTNLESTVEIRIEQPPDWTAGTESCP